jgi:hypothetical protein
MNRRGFLLGALLLGTVGLLPRHLLAQDPQRCRDIYLRRTRSRRRPQTPAPPPVDGAVRVVAAVLAKVAADAVVRAVDAAPAKVADAVVRAADAAPAKVGAARARAEEARGRVDADLAREASRHVIRRHLRSRVPKVPRGA